MDEEVNYRYAGDLRETDYEGENWSPVYRCPRCFGLVESMYTEDHNNWHRKLEETK
jgi:hypothetical protein